MLKHAPLTVEIEMTNTLSDKPVEVYNTVAKFRKRKPDEVVILGAHLDSWIWERERRTTVRDDGVLVEAARTLAKLNLPTEADDSVWCLFIAVKRGVGRFEAVRGSAQE